MTTNYGARPGLEHDGVHCACGNVVGADGVRCVECAPEVAQPRTMSAERERVIREHNVSLTGTPRDLRDVLVELEQERILHAAERERHAATLADLRRIEAYMAPHPAEGNMALAVTFGMVRAAIKRAAGERKPEGLAQARGSRGAS